MSVGSARPKSEQWLSELSQGPRPVAVHRLRLPAHPSRPWVALPRRLRRSATDIVVLEAGPRAWAVAALLKSLGWRVVLLAPGPRHAPRVPGFLDLTIEPNPDTPIADELVAQLAELAGRPGLGISRPPVSVVSTVLNEHEGIEPLIETITPQLGDADELIIVDGGSTDDTFERAIQRARLDPRLRVLRAPGTNIAAGRNIGIRAARHDVIACTDAGCTPSPGWLDAIARPFAECSPPGLAAGVPRVDARGPFERAQSLACYADPHESRRPSAFVQLYGRLFGQTFDPSLPFARSLAFTKDAWRHAGGFPESLGWVEDGVFGRAVATRYRCVLAADADVVWTQRLSARATFLMYYRYGIGAASSGDPQLQGRDAIRAAAYVVAGALITSRRRALVGTSVLGAVAYYSLPMARVLRYRAGVSTAACIPIAMALKDLGKVAGAASRHLPRWLRQQRDSAR